MTTYLAENGVKLMITFRTHRNNYINVKHCCDGQNSRSVPQVVNELVLK